MDFAPYQSEEPSVSRPMNGAASYVPPPVRKASVPPSPPQQPPPPMYTAAPPEDVYPTGYSSSPVNDGTEYPLNQYETSLPFRLDWSAALTYVSLPPVGSVFMLIFETKSDYIRFHAWQASLLFAPIIIIFIILSFSTFLSWVIFGIYVIMALFLAFKAYRGADSLDRLELPFIGRLASDWVDSE
ncbi:uncharacterized protein V1510DRAFT_422485 [Dipodascopsis tothii]|uniref:uncharacterized protein n=1 Tax=Dipodascopsis tothii TaxID=44089 RepID=UPI0034CE7C00